MLCRKWHREIMSAWELCGVREVLTSTRWSTLGLCRLARWDLCLCSMERLPRSLGARLFGAFFIFCLARSSFSSRVLTSRGAPAAGTPTQVALKVALVSPGVREGDSSGRTEGLGRIRFMNLLCRSSCVSRDRSISSRASNTTWLGLTGMCRVAG